VHELVEVGDTGSFLGGLIQAAMGSAGGCGTIPLNRFGLRRNAASRAEARCCRTSVARPYPSSNPLTRWCASGCRLPFFLRLHRLPPGKWQTMRTSLLRSYKVHSRTVTERREQLRRLSSRLPRQTTFPKDQRSATCTTPDPTANGVTDAVRWTRERRRTGCCQRPVLGGDSSASWTRYGSVGCVRCLPLS